MIEAHIKKARSGNLQSIKILWVSFLFLDKHFHKTTQLEILKTLANRGYTTNLIAMRSRDRFQPENSKVRIICIPMRYMPVISPTLYFILLLFFLPFYILISNPDYIIADPDVSILSFFSVIPISKFKGIKLVLDIRSIPVEIIGITGFLRTFTFSTSILIAKKLFDGITIITRPMKKAVCQKFAIDPKRVGVWSSGVSVRLFNPETYDLQGASLREKLGLTGKFVILYHGVFSENRGLTETIKAMSMIKNPNFDMVFFLLGTGPIDHYLKKMVQVNKLHNKIIIHDPVDYSEVPKFIAMSDIGIVPLPDHPYWRLQCPLKLLEYLAMRKVVVISNLPSHQSVVGNEMCGFYVTSVKPAEIAKSIMYLYCNRNNLKEWGASGRKIVEEKYSWEKVAMDLENYLLSIR